MRRGGLSAVTRSLLYQGEALVMIGTALLAGEQDGPVMQACPAPPVPPAEECPPEHPPVEVVPFVQHLDIRMAGDARPLGGGTEPVLTAWLRPKEPAFSPPETALVLLDSMPPALYAATTEPVVAPTADFAVHFADGLATADLGDWTLIRTQVEQASSGWMVDSIGCGARTALCSPPPGRRAGSSHLADRPERAAGPRVLHEHWALRHDDIVPGRHSDSARNADARAVSHSTADPAHLRDWKGLVCTAARWSWNGSASRS
jgi:hypothetical protein